MRNDRPKSVYAIHCVETSRVYIGCCVDVEARVRQHFRELKAGAKMMTVARRTRQETPWQKDYNEYGADAFKVYIMQKDVPTANADEIERAYILQYRANEPEFGYNLRPVQGWDKIDVVDGAPPLPIVRQAG